MSVSPRDIEHLAHALALAERARRDVRPNPLVGCVIVRDDAVIGTGWTQPPGGPHAEIVALREAGEARGATAYVSLEPCSHHGRTPPCADALIAAGVVRVVHALSDPHEAAGGGSARLRAGGVTVDADVLPEMAAEQNRVFLHGIAHERPHVTLKLALTAAGETVVPHREWITGSVARAAVHRERALVDAVLVGSGTALADDPRLDVRHGPVPPVQPRPVLLDARGRTPPTARMLHRGSIVVTSVGPHEWREALRAREVEVVEVAPGPGGGVHLGAALGTLWQRGITAILAEPGLTLASALVAGGHVDRYLAHVAQARPTTRTVTPPGLAPTASWRVRRIVPRGGDLEIERVPRD